MYFTDFPESNAIVPKPDGPVYEHCIPIQIFKGVYNDPIGSLDGSPAIVLAVKPTPEELEALNKGGAIYLMMLSKGMHPVYLTTDNPFEEALVTTK